MLRTLRFRVRVDLPVIGAIAELTMLPMPPSERRSQRWTAQRGLISLVLACLSIFAYSAPSQAQEDSDGIVRYAPGATGAITQDLVEMMRRAKEDAANLKERLSIQGPMSRPDFDVEAARDAALKNPKVLELLGVDGDAAAASAPAQGEAWVNAQAFYFASFSMPDVALKELMLSAHAAGVPVLFRGFYENSVFATNDALMRVFGAAEDIKGFSIDPTLFAQFDINAVPTLVLLKEPYEMCATQACEGDGAPAHDKIGGAITLEGALQIIERGDGEASHVAQRLLAEIAP